MRQSKRLVRLRVPKRAALAVVIVTTVATGSLMLASRVQPYLQRHAPRPDALVQPGSATASQVPAETPASQPADAVQHSTAPAELEPPPPPTRQEAARHDAAGSREAEHGTAKLRPHGESLGHNGKRRPSERYNVAELESGHHKAGAYALITEARRYIGTNPTNRARLWCARFMNFVLNRRGYRGTGSDAALSFAHYGNRVPGPRIGAIAVMRRVGGGHVGIVSGIDRHGNPILISGNNGRSGVAETVYPRSRIIAYVMPDR